MSDPAAGTPQDWEEIGEMEEYAKENPEGFKEDGEELDQINAERAE